MPVAFITQSLIIWKSAACCLCQQRQWGRNSAPSNAHGWTPFRDIWFDCQQQYSIDILFKIYGLRLFSWRMSLCTHTLKPAGLSFLGDRDAANFSWDFATDAAGWISMMCPRGHYIVLEKKSRRIGEDCLLQKNAVHKSHRRLTKYLILFPDKGVLISRDQIQTPKGIKFNAAN